VVRLFEPSGKFRFAWPWPPAVVRTVKFSPDSSRVLCNYPASGYGNNPIGACVMSLTDGREVARFLGTRTS
jgi:hypothetical protein